MLNPGVSYGSNHGEMYMYEAGQTVTINTTDVYHAVYGYSEGSTEGFTFDAGRQVDANITSEADDTQLKITTSAAHNLTTGDVVTLSNMNNAGHNGVTVVTVVDATNFTCDDIAYVAGAGVSAGVVDEPAYLEVDTGSAGIYIGSFSISCQAASPGTVFKWEFYKHSTALDTVAAERNHSAADMGCLTSAGIISLAVGDRLWLACMNKTDASDVTIEHSNIYLHRL